MNKLLVSIVLCIPLICYAVEPKEMYMSNDAGGFVVLTTEPCAFASATKEYPYRAYATESSDIVMHEGCWTSPDTSEVPTEVFSKSEGAPEAPKLHVIQMVSTWWTENARATYLQSHFTPTKKRYLSNGGVVEMTLPPR